jgi:hypothetical protein
MGHLTTAKKDTEFHLVPFGKKLTCVPSFEVDIVLVGTRMQPHLLQLLLMLVLSLRFVALLLFVFELAEVDNLADRGGRLWSNLHKVELLIHCKLKSFACGHEADLLAVLVDDAYAWCPNFSVDARLLLPWRGLGLFPNYSCILAVKDSMICLPGRMAE